MHMRQFTNLFFFHFFITFQHQTVCASDENGYIIYCPCMGRFGNQADHLLGSLSFAQKIDRTLVLPPWPTMMGFVEFNDWFKMEVIETHQRVVTAKQFMTEIAPDIWPVGQRLGFCYMPYRHRNSQNTDKCDLKHGSPFSNFWDNLRVDFDSTLFYNLTYSKPDIALWKDLYPASKYPVLAFKGAPASYPVRPEDVELQKYLWWSDDMVETASHLLSSYFRNDEYIAVHLRNGIDWESACSHLPDRITFMSSPQCTGYLTQAPLTMDMCLPDTSHVIQRIREAVEYTNITNVYILTDQYPLISEINENLSDLHVKAVHGDPAIPQHDLIIAAKAQLFIGNCISSFTAFIKRERDHILNKPTWFFGVDPVL